MAWSPLIHQESEMVSSHMLSLFGTMLLIYGVRTGFDEETLHTVVQLIVDETQELLEVVNHNVRSQQYVCAGHFRTLHVMTQILDRFSTLPPRQSAQASIGHLRQTIHLEAIAAQALSTSDALQRGKATIPLRGIEVPFHSRREYYQRVSSIHHRLTSTQYSVTRLYITAIISPRESMSKTSTQQNSSVGGFRMSQGAPSPPASHMSRRYSVPPAARSYCLCLRLWRR